MELTVVRNVAILLAFIVVAFPEPARCQDGAEDHWAMVRTLEGVWEGTGAGFGQTSKVIHRWEFVLKGEFLRLQTESVVETPEGEGETHEDVGYVSWSEGEKVLRFRQFLSEGFVNTFTISRATSPESGINFDAESTEGMDAISVGMTLRFRSADAYDMVLAMGKKDSELKACQTISLRRVK